MSLLFRRPVEQRAMESWIDADGFVARPMEGQATHLAPVFAAIRHIVDYGSTLPIDCFRKVDEKTRVSMPLPRLLARQDDPGGIGLEQWIGQAFYAIAVHGNAVGWAGEHDGFGYPIDVQWLPRHCWSWDHMAKQWYVFGAPVPFANIVHIPWLVPTGHRLGMSPIEHYASIVAAGLSAQDYADMKRGGGLPPMMLKNVDQKLENADANIISDRLSARLTMGKPFVAGKDWELTATTLPANQAQYIETLKLSANQIAAIYGIDAIEIGGEVPSSLHYTTEELRQIRRAADMHPYLVRVERTVARLLPNRQYMRFNVDANMRIDIKSRIEVEGAQIADGRLSVNEARALEERLPVPGGDFHNVPAPMQDPTTRVTGVTP